MFELRDYQIAALDAIDKAAKRGVQRQLVAHATGLGKTVTFSHLLWERSIAGHRGLVLVHRDELARQTVDKLSLIAPDLNVGIVKAELDEYDAEIVVASVQTVSRYKRLAALRDFGTVVVDEAHHANAESYRRVLQHVGSFTDGGPLTVGFTATPERGDGAGLDAVWQKIVHEVPIITGILNGYLCDVIGQTVGTDLDLSGVKVSQGDLQAGDLGEAIQNSDAIPAMAEAYAKFASDRKGIVFTPTVQTARDLAHQMTLHGIRTEAVDGSQDPADRHAILHRLRTGQTQVVTNCMVLTEGFDEPSISCVVIARPTKSHGLFVQMVGRGTRLYPGKKDLLVLDLAGASERNDLITVASLAGVAQLARGESLTDATERALREAGEAEQAELVRAAQTKAIDLFKSRMRWLPIEDGFCLALDGKYTLIVYPNADDTWNVVYYRPPGFKFGRDIKKMHSGLPLGYAQAAGEQIAGGSISQRDAYWTTLPPTPAQLTRLLNEGLPEKHLKRIRTRGQAADLATRIQARKVLRRIRGAKI